MFRRVRTWFSTKANTFRSPREQNMKVIILEGNIGSGKTTLLEKLKSKLDNVDIREEPIELWKDLNGVNLIQKRYENPHEWSFILQSYIQLTMTQQHQRKEKGRHLLLERSVWSARYVFAEYLAKTGELAPVEIAVLDEWFKFITKKESVEVDLILFLEQDPVVCLERIQQREKNNQNITLQYLIELELLYKDWLRDQPVKVIYISDTTELHEIIKYIQQ